MKLPQEDLERLLLSTNISNPLCGEFRLDSPRAVRDFAASMLGTVNHAEPFPRLLAIPAPRFAEGLLLLRAWGHWQLRDVLQRGSGRPVLSRVLSPTKLAAEIAETVLKTILNIILNPELPKLAAVVKRLTDLDELLFSFVQDSFQDLARWHSITDWEAGMVRELQMSLDLA